jgi:ABC-type transporter Mla subunit MlaD
MSVARRKNATRKAPAAGRTGAPKAGRKPVTRHAGPAPAKPSRKQEAPEPISQALRNLRQVTDALHYAHQSFADALLKLPRPEDFEPLLAPLREFARVSPSLVEAFRGVIVTTRALIPSASAEASGASASPAMDKGRVDEALAHVDAALQALRRALADLPGDAAYRPVARQLRELASVSPSLMDWLKEVPKVTTPLSASVTALRRAVEDLETARDLLTDDVPTAAAKPH